mmetsp:Transcript_24504/g.36715  ORF Transcript_24504/g.36715 Transcript_24504/m.36715 type:complete len:93 (-) Transcript_24504:1432-1710(-)
MIVIYPIFCAISSASPDFDYQNSYGALRSLLLALWAIYRSGSAGVFICSISMMYYVSLSEIYVNEKKTCACSMQARAAENSKIQKMTLFLRK